MGGIVHSYFFSNGRQGNGRPVKRWSRKENITSLFFESRKVDLYVNIFYGLLERFICYFSMFNCYFTLFNNHKTTYHRGTHQKRRAKKTTDGNRNPNHSLLQQWFPNNHMACITIQKHQDASTPQPSLQRNPHRHPIHKNIDSTRTLYSSILFIRIHEHNALSSNLCD